MQIMIFPASATWCRAENFVPGDGANGEVVEEHTVPDDFTDDECSDLARERHTEAT